MNNLLAIRQSAFYVIYDGCCLSMRYTSAHGKKAGKKNSCIRTSLIKERNIASPVGWLRASYVLFAGSAVAIRLLFNSHCVYPELL